MAARPVNLVSMVIPCYRSADSIAEVVAELAPAITDAGYRDAFVLVNDGSPDNTWQTLCQLHEERDDVIAASHTRNYGEHNAVMTGLQLATGDVAVVLDDDGQHTADGVLALVQAVADGADVAFGRYDTKQHGLLRNLGSTLNNRLAGFLLDKPRDLYLSSFKAISGELLPHLSRFASPFPYVDGILLWLTTNVVQVPVPHRERASGESGYNLRRLVRLHLNMLTGFSVMPLRLATLLGLAFACLGAVLCVAVVVEKLLHPDLQAGWASMAVAVLMFNGLVLVLLGIVGEYVGRVFLVLNNKPQSCLREVRQPEGAAPATD
jgi:undecaprenyl-phosphate 4-deoxy-4-formamido-L-arabinose transferase